MARLKQRHLARLLRREARQRERAERSRIGVEWHCERCHRLQSFYIPELTPNQANQSVLTVECGDCGHKMHGMSPTGWERSEPYREKIR